MSLINPRVLRIIPLLIAVCIVSFPAQAQYGGGTGEPNEPYLIYTPEQMNEIGARPSDWDKHFKLMADLDLSAYTGVAFNVIGTSVPGVGPRAGWTPKPFTGVFDGNGHVISNFAYAAEGKDYIGLFGLIDGENAEIRNLGLIDPDVGVGVGLGRYVGVLAGSLGGTVRNCFVEGSTVSGRNFVGGLVGQNSGGTVIDCSCTGTVSGNDRVGGLIGANDGGTIMNCCSAGSVAGVSAVGGVVGDNADRITNSYSSADVTGQWGVGGLVGESAPMGAISNCYSTGSVSGVANVGGLVGFVLIPQSVTRSFWDVEASGQRHSAGGIGLTTAEMQTAVTFLAWTVPDNEETWTIDEGNDYPRLAWENQPGEPIAAIPLADFLAGSGAEDDPFLIYTAEELNLIGWGICDWDKHFKLMADINLSAYRGTEFNIIGITAPYVPFAGVFDGNGHTIANFSYTCTDATSAGLFGYVTDWSTNTEIKNLGLINPNVDAGKGDCAGSLVGYLGVATVTNCYVKGGTVSGDDRIGGLIGLINGGRIVTSYSTATVNGEGNVGGLVGSGAGAVHPVIGCFWDIQTSGQAASAGGTGKTTAEMQTAATFIEAGWDFVDEIVNGTCDYWQIEPGDYPRLRYSAGASPVMPEGLGTAEQPYLIRDTRDLGTVWFEPLAHYRLEASLDLSGTTWSMAVVPWFGGTFDGNGQVISDLHIQGYGYLGLFGQLGHGAAVSNLGLQEVDVNGTGNYVGGLVGYSDGRITTSYGSGTVCGRGWVGGLAGYNEGSIATSYGSGTVCGSGVGGLVGLNAGNVTQCYTSGLIIGTGQGVGGLVGSNYSGDLSNCYSTSTVSGEGTLGGLVGDNWGDASITSSFWDVKTSGQATNAGGIGKTTAEMQTASTFLEAGWDFVDETVNGTEDIWWIDEGQDYPRLWWESIAEN